MRPTTRSLRRPLLALVLAAMVVAPVVVLAWRATLGPASEATGDAPRAGPAALVAARVHLASGRFAAARRVLEAGLTRDPDHVESLKVLAALMLAESDAPRGLDLLRRAARVDPADPRPWQAMGKVHLMANTAVEAEAAFAEALRLAPDLPEALAGRVEALLDLGRADEAGPLIDGALRRHPDDPALLGLAARQAIDSGDPAAALARADSALARDPGNLDALLARGQAHLVGSGPAEARAAFERASVLEPGGPKGTQALHLLALAQARSGDAEAAAATRDQHRQALGIRTEMARLIDEIASRPADPAPRWQLGRLAAAAGARTLAESSFRAALERDPNCRPALEGLAALARGR